MIRDWEIERVRLLVDRSGVVPLVEAEMRRRGTGRLSSVTLRDWFVCEVLTAIHGQNLHSSEVRRMFTDLKESTLAAQFLVGTRIPTSDVLEGDRIVSVSPFETRLRTMNERLSFLQSSAPDITPEEAMRREALQQEISYRLLRATRPIDLPDTRAMAADSTAVEAWGQFRIGGNDPDARPGYRTPKLGERSVFHGHAYFVFSSVDRDGVRPAVAAPRLFEQLVVRPANVEGGVGIPVLPFALRAAAEGRLQELLLDSAWFNTSFEDFFAPLQEAGVRVIIPPKASMKRITVRADGTPMFFAVPLCPGTPQEMIDLARTLKQPAAMTLEPGFTEQELDELARMADQELDAAELVLPDDADQEIHLAEDDEEYEQPVGSTPDEDSERWWRKVRKLSWPERREHIKRRKHNVYEDTIQFIEASEKVKAYALTRKESATAENGWQERWECGAKSGLLRCPRIPESMLIDPADRPTVLPCDTGFCAQTRPADGRDKDVRDGTIPLGTPVYVTSLRLDRNERPKVRSKHFPGTLAWIKDVTRRSRVEGDFGVLKSQSGSGLTKGYFAVGGQAAHVILGTIVLAARNMKNIEAWLARGGETADPLYAPEPVLQGFGELTVAQAAQVRRSHLDRTDQQAA